MNGRRGLAVLLGAGLLAVAAVGTALAAAPTYTIDVTKTADPASVPVEGADVTFTVHVHNTGTGGFATVVVTDPLSGCTLGAPSGDNGNDTLDAGETWDYSCLVADVAPGTVNTATVDACHNSSPTCQQDPQRTSDQGSVEVGTCESDCPTNSPSDSVSESPSDSAGGSPSDSSGGSPSGTGSGAGDTAPPPTDTLGGSGGSGPADSAWLLVVALGVLLGSVVVLRPSTGKRHR